MEIKVQYAILRVKKVMTKNGAKALENHNNRVVDCPHAMPEYKEMNTQPIGTKDVKADIDKILEANGITEAKIQPTNVLALNFMLSASPSYFNVEDKYGVINKDYVPNPDDPLVTDWLEMSTKYLKSEFGENIAQLHVFFDTKTVHLSALCVPVVDQVSKAKIKRADRTLEPHKLAASRWVDGPVKLREMHKNYHQFVKDCGNGLALGVANTKGSNELYKERASRQIEEYKKELERVKSAAFHENKRIKEEADEANAKLKDLEADNERLQEENDAQRKKIKENIADMELAIKQKEDLKAENVLYNRTESNKIHQYLLQIRPIIQAEMNKEHLTRKELTDGLAALEIANKLRLEAQEVEDKFIKKKNNLDDYH